MIGMVSLILYFCFLTVELRLPPESTVPSVKEANEQDTYSAGDKCPTRVLLDMRPVYQ